MLNAVVLGEPVAPAKVSTRLTVGVPAAPKVPETVEPETISEVPSLDVAEIVEPAILPWIVAENAVPTVAAVFDSVSAANVIDGGGATGPVDDDFGNGDSARPKGPKSCLRRATSQ